MYFYVIFAIIKSFATKRIRSNLQIYIWHSSITLYNNINITIILNIVTNLWITERLDLRIIDGAGNGTER